MRKFKISRAMSLIYQKEIKYNKDYNYNDVILKK